MKPYGIAIYGFIDCWARKFLGLFAHITNSDPRHVGLWFLQIVEDVSGRPQKLTTERGTETLDVASLQVSLGQMFSDKNTAQQEQLHLYVKSTRNQKIECFWNQMKKGVREAMKQGIEKAIREVLYDDENVFQKYELQFHYSFNTFLMITGFNIGPCRLLFLQIYTPMAQNKLSRYMEYYNSFPRVKDKWSHLPTGCSANYCYRNPKEEFGGIQGLIPLPLKTVDEIRAADYPEGNQLWTFTPEWFSAIVNEAMNRLGYNYNSLLMTNIWDIFVVVLADLKLRDWSGTPFENYFS